ncbi:MAG: thiamine phosphate synthase [Planctomycetes bacterium]|nr:thiamine phosphate synthase [Planctomycetota bacterium]
MNDPVARIIDVNLNRAGEALRTLEEFGRFVQDSPAMAERCKEIRHHLALTARAWTAHLAPADQPLSHRDIMGDVGAGIKTAAETKRTDALAVATAASRRAAEALRTLSEYGKITNPELAAAFEKIRYELYALEPVILADATLRKRLASARLCVLVTTALSSAPPLDTAREAIAGGADVIQFREKEMEDGEFHAIAQALAELCRDRNAILIINDRPHIAGLVDAGGVHGGQGDLPIHLTRRIIGTHKLIGRSTAAPEFAELAAAEGADYIGVGPVFPTATKPERPAAGLEYVTWASSWGKLPYFAIGGITRRTLDAVLDAGARAVAVASGITKATDIAAETAWFKNRLLERDNRFEQPAERLDA